jgi:hypothetical protein
MLTWTLPDHSRFVAMIEVKYRSGKSGEGVVEELGQVAVSDQLGREHQDLVDLLGPADQAVLVYLTAHPGLPCDDLANSLALIQPDPRTGVYWLNWIAVYRAIRRARSTGALNPWEDALWSDMQCLLERKGLTGLRSWDEVLPVRSSEAPIVWYERRARPKQYIWPNAVPPLPLLWYQTKLQRSYRWHDVFASAGAIRFYSSKGSIL